MGGASLYRTLPTNHGPPGRGYFAVTRELCEWEYGIVGSDGDFGLIAIILLALARQRNRVSARFMYHFSCFGWNLTVTTELRIWCKLEKLALWR
jgi:hypothetical protein